MSLGCTCPRDSEGQRRFQDPYCPVHGRIRDMDAGASPFVNVEEVEEMVAGMAGISPEEKERLEREVGSAERSEVAKRLAREAAEREAREVKMHDRYGAGEAALDAVDALKSQIPEGCLCTYSSGDYGAKRYPNERCPIHGNPDAGEDQGI